MKNKIINLFLLILLISSTIYSNLFAAENNNAESEVMLKLPLYGPKKTDADKVEKIKLPEEAEVISAKEFKEKYFVHLSKVYREYFDSYLEEEKTNVLVLEANTQIDNDLRLDWDTDLISQYQLTGIYVKGELTVKGEIYNAMLEGGPFLIVDGDVTAQHIFKGGAFMLIMGDVHSEGVVFGYYNDGWMRIEGDVYAKVVISDDNDLGVNGVVHGLNLLAGYNHYYWLHPDILGITQEQWNKLYKNVELDFDYLEHLQEKENVDIWINDEKLINRARQGLPIIKYRNDVSID